LITINYFKSISFISFKAVAIFLRPLIFFFDPALGQLEVVEGLGVDLKASAEVPRHVDVAGLDLVMLLHVEALDIFLDRVEAFIHGLGDAPVQRLLLLRLRHQEVSDLCVVGGLVDLVLVMGVDLVLRVMGVDLLPVVTSGCGLLLLLNLEINLVFLLMLHLNVLLLLDQLHGTHLAQVLPRSSMDEVRGFDSGDDSGCLVVHLLLLLGSGDDDAGASFLLWKEMKVNISKMGSKTYLWC
jgi:hypothetical protein